jgi:hypothetical protein
VKSSKVNFERCPLDFDEKVQILHRPLQARR